jgi:tape measure domain-containing protein
MAKSTTGGKGLSLTAKLNVAEAIAAARLLKKEIAGISGVSQSGGKGAFDTKPLTGYQQAQIALKKTLLETQVASQKLRNDTLELNTSYAQGRISAQQLAAAERQAVKDRRALADATRAARQAQQAASGSYDEAVAKLRTLGRAIKAAEGGFNSTNPAIRAQITEYNNLNTALKKFDAEMGNHQRKVGDYRGALNGVVGDLKAMALSYLSVQGALQLATASFGSNRQLQAVQASLAFTLGSVDAANDKINELRKNALLLGQDFNPVVESYAKFAGAARAANFPLSETDRIFKAVSVAGARFNLTSDQMSGALLALQQMISKGTVQSEELRGQLGERLPGAFTIAAKAMGVNEKQLGKLLQTGQVLASDLLPKLATQLEKDFGLKAGESIDNLNASVGRLSTSFDTLIQGDKVGGFFKTIIDGAAHALTEINKLFTAKSVSDFFGRGLSFDTRIWDRKENIETNFNSSNSVLKNQNINPIGTSDNNAVASLAKSGVKDLEELRQTYIKATKQAEIAVNAYKKGIAKGDLTDEGKISVKAATDNFNQLQKSLTLINSAYQQIKPKVITANKEITDAQLTSIKEIRKRIAELSALPGSAIDGSEIDNRIEALKARLSNRKVSVNSAGLTSRDALQKSIDDLTIKGTNKQLDADAEEVASVKKKYADKLQEAKTYNEKQAKLDDEARKKGQKPLGLRVNASGLDRAQSNEVAAVEDKQKTEKLKITLDTQKKMYDEYEAYKSKVGEEEANKRFGKDLNNYATYLEALNAKRDALLNQDQKSKGGSEADNAAVQLQLKLVDEEIAAEVIANKKKNDEIYADAYQAALTNSQALLGIEADYQRQVLALGKGATKEQVDNLKRLRDARVRSENEANSDQKSGYADLMENIDAMTRGKAIKELEASKNSYTKDYKNKLITAKFYADRIAEINDKIDSLDKNNIFNGISRAVKRYKDAKKAFDDAVDPAGKKKTALAVEDAQVGMFESIAGAAADATEVIGQLANSLQELGIGGEGLQDTFKNITGIISGNAQLAKGIITGNPVDIVTGSIGLLTSAISLFSHKDKDLQKKIDGYKKELDALGRAYANLDRQVQNSVGESVYTDQQSQIDNLIKQQAKLTQMRDAEVDKKKTDEDKVQEFQNQIDSIPGQIQDIQQSISQNLIQTTFKDLSNSLADAFTEAFTAGEDAAGRFDDVFEKVIANAIKNSLKLKILDPIVKKFTDDLTAYALANNNSVIGFDFDSYKKQLQQAGELFNAGLKGAEEFFQSSDTSSNVSAVNKGIQAITSDQANALEGITRGTYDQTKQLVVHTISSNALLTGISNSMGEIFLIATNNLAMQAKIEANTANTVSELKNAVTELKAINTNTKPSSGRGTGLI